MTSPKRDWVNLGLVPTAPAQNRLVELLRHPMVVASFSILLSSCVIWNYQRKSEHAKEIALLRSRFVEDIQVLNGRTASYLRNLSALNQHIKLKNAQYSKQELNLRVNASQAELNDLYERLGRLAIQANLYYSTNETADALHDYKLFIHSAINKGLTEAQKHGDVEPVLKKYLDSSGEHVAIVINAMGVESPFRARIRNQGAY